MLISLQDPDVAKVSSTKLTKISVYPCDLQFLENPELIDCFKYSYIILIII